MITPEILAFATRIQEYDIFINNPGQSSCICSVRLLAAALAEDMEYSEKFPEWSWVTAIYEDGYNPDTCPLREGYKFLTAVIDTSYV